MKNLSKFFSIVCVMIFGLCFKQVVRAEFKLDWHAKITIEALNNMDTTDFPEGIFIINEDFIHRVIEASDINWKHGINNFKSNYNDALLSLWSWKHSNDPRSMCGGIPEANKKFLKYLFFKQKRFYGGVSDDAAVEATKNEINKFVLETNEDELHLLV